MVSQELLLRQPTTSFDLHKNYSTSFANILRTGQANRLALRGERDRACDRPRKTGSQARTQPLQRQRRRLHQRAVIRVRIQSEEALESFLLCPEKLVLRD